MANSQKTHRHSISGTYAHCKMGCWRCFKLLPVLLIVSIVTWSYYAYVYQLCILTINSMVQKIIYLILYHIFLIMFAWSYWRTVFAEIKPVPDKFKLPEEELQKLLNAENEEAQRIILESFAKDLPLVTRTTAGLIRYCNRCVLVKPDRAHHCSICHRCVLKMDHHCPWVNNCVCYFNYKFFMLFLGYALLYCIYIMATCLPFFIMFWKGEFGTSVPVERYHIMFEFFVALMFGISLASLFGYHCYLVVNNRTTIDEIARHSKRRGPSGTIFKSMLDSIGNEAFRAPTFRGGPDKNGFSIGAFKNFKQIFGNNPKFWLLPVFTSIGDGSDYPVRPEHSLQTFTTQPELTYESMGTTRPSIGDGVGYPQPYQEEDTESLLSSERWDRWGERSRPFDERESSSFDEL